MMSCIRGQGARAQLQVRADFSWDREGRQLGPIQSDWSDVTLDHARRTRLTRLDSCPEVPSADTILLTRRRSRSPGLRLRRSRWGGLTSVAPTTAEVRIQRTLQSHPPALTSE